MALLIPANPQKPVRQVQPANGTDFTNEELESLLGCQSINFFDRPGGYLVVNERAAWTDNYIINRRAMKVADLHTMCDVAIEILGLQEQLKMSPGGRDVLAGDVLFCDKSEIR